VYRPILGPEPILKVACKGHWPTSTTIKVLEVNKIVDKVATFNMPGNQVKVWIMRKHPGLAMLNAEETEATADKTGDENGDDNDAYW
jgi:hypothetical protein